MRTYALMAAIAASFAGASGANANILATGTNTNTVAGGSSPVNVTVQQSGGTALAFSTSKNKQKVVITFNAECRAVGNGWMSVLVLVDGHPTDPQSGNDFALCTPGANFVGAVRQSVFVVPVAGAHSVTILAQGIAGNNDWTLDDISLAVES